MSEIHITAFQKADTAESVDLFYDTVHEINRVDYSKEAITAWAPIEEKENIRKEWELSFLKNKTFIARMNEQLVGFTDIRADGYLDPIVCT